MSAVINKILVTMTSQDNLAWEQHLDVTFSR